MDVAFVADPRNEELGLTTEMYHRDGVSWWDAPKPGVHFCRVQTCGYSGFLTYVERCACGAIRMQHARQNPISRFVGRHWWHERSWRKS